MTKKVNENVKNVNLDEEKLIKFGIMSVPVQIRLKTEKENAKKEKVFSCDLMGWGFRGKVNLKSEMFDTINENEYLKLYFKTKAAGTKVTLDVIRFGTLEDKIAVLDPVKLKEVMVTSKEVLTMEKKQRAKDENGQYISDGKGGFVEENVLGENGVKETVDYYRLGVTGNGLSTTFTVPEEIYKSVDELNVYEMEFGFKTVEGKMIMDLIAVNGAIGMDIPEEA